MKRLLVVALAGALALALALPAVAEVKIGGKMLTDFGYRLQTKELTNSGQDVGSLFTVVTGYSRLFVFFANADKSNGGHVELGLSSHTSASVGLRHVYGWWQVGRCKLLAGHTDNWFGSAAMAPGQNVGFTPYLKWLLIDWGNVWGVRRPQVSFTWQNGGFGYQIGLAQPLHGSSVGWTDGDVYNLLPEIWAALTIKSGGFVFMPGVSFTRYQAEGASTGDDSVDAWMVNLPVKLAVGSFTILAGLHFGKNPGLTPAANWVDGANARPVLTASGAFEDTENYGGYLGLNYQAPAFRAYSGVGVEKYGNDTWYKGGYCRYAGFLGVLFKITGNFSLNPELGYYNHGDNPNTGTSAGHEIIAGMQFAFLF